MSSSYEQKCLIRLHFKNILMGEVSLKTQTPPGCAYASNMTDHGNSFDFLPYVI